MTATTRGDALLSAHSLLLLTAIGVAFLHTVLGPDHYLPFVGMARAFHWSRVRLLTITLVCGVGHVLSSVVLGVLGIVFGWGLAHLRIVESARGQVAAYGLVAFGLIYFAWGMKRALRHRPHEHLHVHSEGNVHLHTHTHERDHLHIHGLKERVAKSPTLWMLFSIFLLGPCEPLIPLLMYPATQKSWTTVALVSAAFGLTTLITMSLLTVLCAAGVQHLRLGRLERFTHAAAGAAVAVCGLAIVFLHI
jgi:nickel/cobalt transporter (NicO) family protein